MNITSNPMILNFLFYICQWFHCVILSTVPPCSLVVTSHIGCLLQDKSQHGLGKVKQLDCILSIDLAIHQIKIQICIKWMDKYWSTCFKDLNLWDLLCCFLSTEHYSSVTQSLGSICYNKIPKLCTTRPSKYFPRVLNTDIFHPKPKLTNLLQSTYIFLWNSLV